MVACGVSCDGYVGYNGLLPHLVCTPGCARRTDFSVFAFVAVLDCLYRVDIDTISGRAG